MLTNLVLILLSITALSLNHTEDKDANKYVFYGTFLIINIVLLFGVRNLISYIIIALLSILCIFAFIKISFKNNKLSQQKSRIKKD
ncbi:hypothetical protein C672_3460 [[Clostridium] bifermentans ATCC 638]|uniref:Uncharacterized protein n=1 Tax=Paraclostridium bifermentans ATCC 638 = DSM 14991 TaxID=1233171 RepID=T4V977_PARBF|nr:hypothetical protein [Paraclostridium bifermentans]EQK40269.1 hypothetical protein C672_3460 [[Clostridium] bifermentans ATCC 638] [Paraclostridium bifermentans ATCC 638 = DSM 14991]RIZ57688.1 hypothetical protein CHH45_15245 [Paraclostridium bifermentans]UAG20000.1 hypothetical protein KXZ80_17390 [Paraclostridium bifermentans]